jgi:hypothetical protein
VAAYKWWEQHARLWSELVPQSGQAAAVQDELVRCIGKLTDEAYRNGNINWEPGSGHERMLDFIPAMLLGDNTFEPERQSRIRKDISEIRNYKKPNVGGHGTCYYTLSEAVVDWCMLHPQRILQEINPDLKM